MELQAAPTVENNSTVDTSRAFSSVKEAVAIFGEKILSGELYSSPTIFTMYTPKQELSPLSSSSSTSVSKQGECSPIPTKTKNGEQFLIETLNRLETELEGTKKELKLLKERESETEIALASLNAELHKNMSKIAQSEANAAARARTRTRTSSLIEGERKRDSAMKTEVGSPTLAQILGFGETKQKRDLRKKQPVVPLLTHLFSRKKLGANASLRNSLLASTRAYLN